MKWIAALTLAVMAGHAQAAEKILHFYGYAYDLESNRYLYTEVHSQRIDGKRWLGGTMDYYDPSGKKIATKTLDFSDSPTVPLYRLDLLNDGYAEGISKIGSEIEIFKRESSKTKLETGVIDNESLIAADSGFHTFIRQHFDELMRGERVSFRMVVAGQMDSYQFRLRKTGETIYQGKPAVNIVAEPDSLLRLIVDPLLLTYELATQKLLEYRGVSNLHDPATGEAYNARIIYPDQPPADAPKKLPPLK